MIVRTGPAVSYSMWLKKILDTHTSQAWDSEPTDIRERQDEELNDLWTEIDECQKQRLWGLSSDLNTLRDRETWVESDWSRMSVQELARAQDQAFRQKDWDKLLEYLRRPPRFVPRDKVDYMRGRAWMEMGHSEVALLFFDNAARLGPESSNYRVLALECLRAMRNWPAILQRCQSLLHDSATPPRLLFRAADALQAYANHTGDRQYYQEALRAIDEGFGRLDHSGDQEQLPSILAGAYATKSFCLGHLGHAKESLHVLDEAVQRFSENTTLLTARGLLKQEIGLSDAVDDFREAVARGTSVVWAYVELARDALCARRNQHAVDLCRRGLALAPGDVVAAILFELLAIGLLRLEKVSANVVRAAFQRAGELDPLSEEIRFNCERFESFVVDTQTQEPQWQLDSLRESAMEDVYAQLQAAA